MVQKLVRIKKVIKVGKIIGKDYILNIEDKGLDLIRKNTKIIPGITPRQRYLEARRLRIKKRL